MTWLHRSGWQTAKTTKYNGSYYDSKFEAGYAMYLDSEMRAGRIESYERQVDFELHGPNGTKIWTYRADFVVTLPDGSKEIHEPKGFRTAVFNAKWKMLEDEYGEEYTLILVQLQKRKPARKPFKTKSA